MRTQIDQVLKGSIIQLFTLLKRFSSVKSCQRSIFQVLNSQNHQNGVINIFSQFHHGKPIKVPVYVHYFCFLLKNRVVLEMAKEIIPDIFRQIQYLLVISHRFFGEMLFISFTLTYGPFACLAFHLVIEFGNMI